MVGEAAKPRLLVRTKQPALVDQARDLRALRDMVVDAAAVGAGLWFSYVFVQLYLLIAVGSVTQRNLLFEDPVRLPFLNVDLPLVGFFILGPALFLIVHTYVLLHFVLFAAKVGIFHKELKAQILDGEIRGQLQAQLPSNIFVQLLAGTAEIRGGIVGHMLRVVANISLVIGPVVLLMLFQIKFLPYHPPPSIALWLRVAVVVDIVLLWTLWPSIARGEVTWLRWSGVQSVRNIPASLVRFLRTLSGGTVKVSLGKALSISWSVLRCAARRASAIISALGTLLPVLIVFTISTFPGEWLDDKFKSMRLPNLVRRALLPNDQVSDGWFWNRLVLTDQALIDPDKLEKASVSRSFQRRDLREADFSRTDLRNADFTGAMLDGATFEDTNLERAQFGCTTSHSCTLLRGADFKGAQLRESVFIGAKVQGADLSGANLQGALLLGTQLQGSNLSGAGLQGAVLSSAGLEGALLARADLQGALLSRYSFAAQSEWSVAGKMLAAIRGEQNFAANLQGANLRDANLQGANLDEVKLQGAHLGGARLRGASFARAFIWRVRGTSVSFDLTVLGGCRFDVPWFGSSFAEWRKRILSDIPAGSLRDDAETRISMMRADQADVIEEEFWKNHCSTRSSDQEIQLAAFFADLACSNNAGPYLTRGLLRNGRVNFTQEIATAVFGKLEKGKKEPEISCPGVLGFTNADWLDVHNLGKIIEKQYVK